MAYTNLKNVKKRILKLKLGIEKGSASINSTLKGMIKNVNSVINNLSDDSELRDSFYNGSSSLVADELSKTFASVPKSFASYGKSASDTFAKGFIENLPTAIGSISAAFAASALSPALSMGLAASAGATYNNSSYNFYGSGLSVSQQLEQARLSALVESLRT